jgi:hypothetical protein
LRQQSDRFRDQQSDAAYLDETCGQRVRTDRDAWSGFAYMSKPFQHFLDCLYSRPQGRRDKRPLELSAFSCFELGLTSAELIADETRGGRTQERRQRLQVSSSVRIAQENASTGRERLCRAVDLSLRYA